MTANIHNIQDYYKTAPRNKNSRVAFKDIIDKYLQLKIIEIRNKFGKSTLQAY